MLHYTSTPIHEIQVNLLGPSDIRLLIKREDLNHQQVSGNKWWKLKYNLEEALQQKKDTILTFGGAYSNHIYSTAAAANELGLKSIGVIRGEETLPLNSTLSFARSLGMQLHYITRDQYRKKKATEFVNDLHRQFGDFYLIPEGGSNALAVKGCAEMATSLNEINFDYLCLPVGTGGTIAGVIAGLKGSKKIIGFPVLKGGEFLKNDIEELLQSYSKVHYTNWTLDASYHHGGYAKTTTALMAFIKEMKEKYNLPLDHVYTGKLLWAVTEYIKLGKFKKGSTVMILHTGGCRE